MRLLLRLTCGFVAAAVCLLTAASVTAENVNVTAEVCASGGIAPVITQPVSGTDFTESLITVKGFANPSEPVVVYRNGVVAGTAPSDPAGDWEVQITLVQGQNVLVAYNCQESAPVTVDYYPPTPPPPSPTPTPQPTEKPTPKPPRPVTPGQSVIPSFNPASGVPATGEQVAAGLAGLVLTSNQSVVHGVAGQPVTLTADVVGGANPYSVEWQWTKQTELSGSQNGLLLSSTHTYPQAGTYTPSLKVTDSKNETAFMQYLVIIEKGSGVQAASIKDNSGIALLSIIGLELLAVMVIYAIGEYLLATGVIGSEVGEESDEIVHKTD